MKAQYLLLAFTLGLEIFTASAFAQSELSALKSSPGFQSDFNYQVTNVATLEEAQAIMDTEIGDLRNKSICANRAEIWSFIMNKQKHIQVGKVSIHFTALGETDDNKQWAYHIAPYILVNGEEYVLDSAFDEFKNHPVKMAEWQKYFGTSPNCVVLDPVHNPAHLKLEANNTGGRDPFDFKHNRASQYPTNEGVCYIRKIPMYYFSIGEVYGADLALSGQEHYSSFIKNSFKQSEVMEACRQAVTPGFRKKTSCEKYFGF